MSKDLPTGINAVVRGRLMDGKVLVDDQPYRFGTQLTPVTINVVLNQGGLGDMIARMPAVRYMADQNPHVTINLWCPHYFIEIAENIWGTHKRVYIKDLIDYSSTCNWDEPHFSFKHSQHTSFSTNLTTHAFNMLVNKEVDPRHHTYPKLFLSNCRPLSISSYMVLTSNYTALARRFMQTEFNKLIKYLTDGGIYVVLLGKKSTQTNEQTGRGVHKIESAPVDVAIDSPYVIDMREKTTLIEAATIMKHAKCVMGIDNGLLHLAACTSVPIIMGFTTVRPAHRQIIRDGQLWKDIFKVVPDTDLACRYCQSRMGLIYGHRFKYCFYDDYKCCEQMTARKFLNKLRLMIGKGII